MIEKGSAADQIYRVAGDIRVFEPGTTARTGLQFLKSSSSGFQF
jgi:hypothetical protein